MIGKLTFKLPEEQEEFQTAIDGWKYKNAMEEVWQRVFRPFFKHGYSNAEIQSLSETEAGSRLIEALAEIYQDVAREMRD
jgi:hypothetical protein